MFSWRFWFLNCVTVGSSDVSAAQIASIFSLTGSNICWSDVFCSGGFNENWPDTTVPICGHKICQTQLYLSVVTKLARHNCAYLWSQNWPDTTVPICGHKIGQTQLWLSVVTKLARHNCAYLWSQNWPDTTVPICGHKIGQTQLCLSVVTKLARHNCDYLWSQNHTKTTTIRPFRLLSDALSHEGNPHYQLRWQVWKKILDIYSRSSVAYYHDIYITLSIEIAVGRGNHSFQIVST